jgi:hypothetical protein
MKYSEVENKAMQNGWILSKLESEFFGNRYQLKHKNGRHHFARTLSEVLTKIEVNETFSACSLDSNIPKPIKFSKNR